MPRRLTERRAWHLLVDARWPDGLVRCPRCRSAAVSWLAAERAWRCRACRARGARAKFSVRTGTPLERSRQPLRVWIAALRTIDATTTPLSAAALGRAIGLRYESALALMRRLQGGPLGRAGVHRGGGRKFHPGDAIRVNAQGPPTWRGRRGRILRKGRHRVQWIVKIGTATRQFPSWMLDRAPRD